MKTYSAKPTDVKREWFIVDASTFPLGRLSTAVATLLMGKNKPMFTSHIDCGDYVVVINSDSLVVTGDKAKQKTYYKYSGFPGGLKSTSLADKKSTASTSVISHAVRGMMPDNKLRPGRLARLKVYPTSEHPHAPQNPKEFILNKKVVKP